MKNSENSPVNEWNANIASMGYETIWPWDVVARKSPEPSMVKEETDAKVAGSTNADSFSESPGNVSQRDLPGDSNSNQ